MSFAAVFDHERPQNFLYTLPTAEAGGRGMDGRPMTAVCGAPKLSYNKNIYCQLFYFTVVAPAECCRLGKGQTRNARKK
jgi:hypothetical protein